MFKRRRVRPLLWFLFFLGLCGGLFVFIEHHLFPTIIAIAEAKAMQMSVAAVNDAVRSELLSRRIRYEDLIAVHKDQAGRVVLIQANAVKITEMASDMAVTVEKTLSQLPKEEFGIPLGQVLGSQILANYGPCIKVRIVPIGAVKVGMLERFDAAGINQTRHRFFLHLDTSVRIVVPLQKKDVRVNTEIPLVENVIVGTVPSTYVNVPGLTEWLASK